MIEDDKMDLNQMDLSDEKKTINYAHLNDEFGDVDISGKFTNPYFLNSLTFNYRRGRLDSKALGR